MIKSNEIQKPTLIQTNEAERLAGVKRGNFVYLRGLGKGPVYLRNGGRILYRKEDVQAWTKENQFVEVKPNAKK